ncbi:MAG: hypothetical protein ACRDT2_06070, partial [Natronosporangium sp.]
MTDDAHRADAPTDPGNDETTARLGLGATATPEPPADAAGPRPAATAPDRVWVNLVWEGTLLVLLAGGIGMWWLLGGTIELLE